MSERSFLPGVPAGPVLDALARAAGGELASGKFDSPESSSALAVNTFGFFLQIPSRLPVLPGTEELDWPAVRVAVEREMRFPWPGGKHPWLDAAVETEEYLLGVEAKRFEPFRDKKKVEFSPAYERDVWGDAMGPFHVMRENLRLRSKEFKRLDAAQLVKHAYGLITEAKRVNKRPVLFYLYAEPESRAGRPIKAEAFFQHRREIDEFASAIAGAEVRFASASYRDWFATWPRDLQLHRENILARFAP